MVQILISKARSRYNRFYVPASEVLRREIYSNTRPHPFFGLLFGPFKDLRLHCLAQPTLSSFIVIMAHSEGL